MRTGVALVASWLLWASSTAAGARTWTDAAGNKVNGDFVRIYNGVVVLKVGTRVIQVPFYGLSREDQNYLRDKLTAEGKRSLVPPPMEDQSPAGGAPPVVQPQVPEPPSAVPVPGVPPAGSVAPAPPPPPPPPSPPPASRLPDVIQPQSVPNTTGYLPVSPRPPGAPVPVITSQPQPATQPPSASSPPRSGEPAAEPPSGSSPSPATYGSPPSRATNSTPSTPTYGTNPTPSVGTSSMPSVGTNPTPSDGTSAPSPYSTSTDSDSWVKVCGQCGQQVPSNLTAGDRCPHCGTYFNYDQTNGRRSSGGSGRIPIRFLVYIGVAVAAGLVELIRRLSGGS